MAVLGYLKREKLGLVKSPLPQAVIVQRDRDYHVQLVLPEVPVDIFGQKPAQRSGQPLLLFKFEALDRFFYRAFVFCHRMEEDRRG